MFNGTGGQMCEFEGNEFTYLITMNIYIYIYILTLVMVCSTELLVKVHTKSEYMICIPHCSIEKGA